MVLKILFDPRNPIKFHVKVSYTPPSSVPTIKHSVHGLENSKSKNENFLHIRGTFYPERACQNRHLQKISPYHFFWSIAIWKCTSQNSHTWKMSEPVARGPYWRAHGPTFRHLPSKNASHKKRKKCCEKFFFRAIPGFSRKWAELYIYIHIVHAERGAVCMGMCGYNRTLVSLGLNLPVKIYIYIYIHIFWLSACARAGVSLCLAVGLCVDVIFALANRKNASFSGDDDEAYLRVIRNFGEVCVLIFFGLKKTNTTNSRPELLSVVQ